MSNTIRTSLFWLFVIALSACNDSSKLATIHQAEMLMQEQQRHGLVDMCGMEVGLTILIIAGAMKTKILQAVAVVAVAVDQE